MSLRGQSFRGLTRWALGEFCAAATAIIAHLDCLRRLITCCWHAQKSTRALRKARLALGTELYRLSIGQSDVIEHIRHLQQELTLRTKNSVDRYVLKRAMDESLLRLADQPLSQVPPLNADLPAREATRTAQTALDEQWCQIAELRHRLAATGRERQRIVVGYTVLLGLFGAGYVVAFASPNVRSTDGDTELNTMSASDGQRVRASVPMTNSPEKLANLSSRPVTSCSLRFFKSLEGHKDHVNCVAFSPSDKLLVSAGSDGEIRTLDVSGSMNYGTIGSHVLPARCVAFSRDGRTLASGAGRFFSGEVALWEAGSKQRRWTTKLKGEVCSLSFSPNGDTLAAVATGSQFITLLDPETGQHRGQLKHEGWLSAIAYSPDGLTLASGSTDATVKLWETKTLNARATLRGHSGEVRCLAFSPDGKTLASGASDQTARLWRVTTGELLETLEKFQWDVHSVAFSSDGQLLAVAAGLSGNSVL